MAWSNITTKSKDAAFGMQSYNIISDDLNYLKTQSEVLVAAGAGAIKPDVVPEPALVVSNAPIEGAKLTARAAVGGGLTWEQLIDDEFFWASR
jgi:hypothetical protein